MRWKCWFSTGERQRETETERDRQTDRDRERRRTRRKRSILDHQLTDLTLPLPQNSWVSKGPKGLKSLGPCTGGRRSFFSESGSSSSLDFSGASFPLRELDQSGAWAAAVVVNRQHVHVLWSLQLKRRVHGKTELCSRILFSVTKLKSIEPMKYHDALFFG